MSKRELDSAIEPGQARRFSRRNLLRSGLAAGLFTPFAATLLAACGSSSSSSESTSEASTASATSAGQPSTASPAASDGQMTATSGTGTPGTGSSGSKFTVEPAKHTGGKLIFGTFADAATMNPVLARDTTSEMVHALIFNGVVKTDVVKVEPVGDLATSWKVSDDGLTYAFVLRDGVKFHDGKPLTANDVKFTYDLIMNKDSKSIAYAALTERVKSVEVEDDTHITFTLKQPNATFLAQNMATGILPQHILEDVKPTALDQSDFSTGKKGVTIGTGPFVFDSWVKDDHLTLTPNADFWLGAPHLENWILKVVPNQTVEVQQLRTGELDYGGIQPADAENMQKQSNVSVHIYDTFSFLSYTYNLDPAHTKVFQDKAVRQALLYGVNRQAIIKSIDFGLSTIAVGTLPVLSWAYDPDSIKLKYDYDKDKADQMLDQAGWKKGSDGIRTKDGVRLAFKLWTNSGNQVREQYVTVLQQEWKEIGVECTPQFEEWNAFLERVDNQHEFEMCLLGHINGFDPDQSIYWSCSAYDGGLNIGKYCNPAADKLLANGLATTSEAARKKTYAQLQNILMEDLPAAVLDFPKSIAGVAKRVHNLFPNAVATTFNAHQWWVDG